MERAGTAARRRGEGEIAVIAEFYLMFVMPYVRGTSFAAPMGAPGVWNRFRLPVRQRLLRPRGNAPLPVPPFRKIESHKYPDFEPLESGAGEDSLKRAVLGERTALLTSTQ